MNRRDFIIKGAVGCSILSSGCIDFTSEPGIQIVNPESGAETGKEFSLSVEVSNYDIRDPSAPVESEDSGYVVITVDKVLQEGSEAGSDNASVQKWLNGQKQDQVDVNVPGDHTIRAYIADVDRKITSNVDSIKITSSFEVPSNITIGQDQSLNISPEYVTIPIGTELTFNWDVNGVNLVPTQTPDESNWEGVEFPQARGYSYSHEFSEQGTYEYKCEPHSDVMRGTIIVT